MSKLLFAGSRIDSVSTVYGTIVDDSSYIDNAYSDAGINVGGGAARINFFDPASAPLLSPYSVPVGNSLYFHAYIGMNFNSAGYNGAIIIFEDSARYPWLQILAYGQWQYNSGTGTVPVWTDIGDNTYGMPGNNRVQASMDVKIDIDAGGNHTLFMAANSVQALAPVVFNQPLMTELSSIIIQRDNSGTESVFSQIMCTENISTVGGHVQTSRATGAGAHSDWTGSYSDVNEVIQDLSNYNQAVTAEQKQSYPMSNIMTPEGCFIQGIFYWLVAKNDGVTPKNIASLLRTGDGTEFVSADLNNFYVSFANIGARYDVNPETFSDWTQTDWNSPIQLGFVSKA